MAGTILDSFNGEVKQGDLIAYVPSGSYKGLCLGILHRVSATGNASGYHIPNSTFTNRPYFVKVDERTLSEENKRLVKEVRLKYDV